MIVSPGSSLQILPDSSVNCTEPRKVMAKRNRLSYVPIFTREIPLCLFRRIRRVQHVTQQHLDGADVCQDESADYF